jgi:prepilin peptidase CpaA
VGLICLSGSRVSIVHYTVVWAFIALLGWAAYSDVRVFIIPNRLSLAIAALYPAHVIASPIPVDWSGDLMVGAIVLGMGFAMFAMRIAGGGDVKLLSVVSLWAGTQHILASLLIMGLAGGVLSVFALVRLRFAEARSGNDSGFFQWFGRAVKTNVAYGISIAVGGLYTAGRLLAG